MSARRRDRGREAAVGPSQRQLRVGEEVRHALVEILRDNHARDPDLQNVNVTVTEVRISPDLGNATAFVMPLGGQKSGSIIAALNRASAYFRTNEPSSPLPMLIDRARRLSEMGFMDILRDLAPDGLMPEALKLARSIAGNNAYGVWQTKIGLNAALDAPSLRHAIELENRTQILSGFTNNPVEAAKAHQEKRAPKWDPL